MEEVGRDVVSSEVSRPPLLQILPLGDSRFGVTPCLSPRIPLGGLVLIRDGWRQLPIPGVREPGPDIPGTHRQVAPGHRIR